jgi:exosome complex component MTR3
MIDASNVKIICSVHGPRHRHGTKYMVDDDIGTLECEVKYGGPLVGVSDKDMTSLGTCPNHSLIYFAYILSRVEINLGSLVKSSIESAIKLTSYPKSVISLHIMILESDIVLSGNNCHYNDYNAAVIVASLALADASIEMYDIVSSCTGNSFTHSFIY